MVEEIRCFIDSGGSILWVLLVFSGLLWALLVERLWFHARIYPDHEQSWCSAWQSRADRSSWTAQRLRSAYLARARFELTRGLVLTRMLVKIAPLLGLLGTVLGMIEVFDVVAFAGTGNARALASGVSRATIPTMAGMVIALSAVFPQRHLEQSVKRRFLRFSEALQLSSVNKGANHAA